MDAKPIIAAVKGRPGNYVTETRTGEVRFEASSYSGPIPPPGMLAAYNQLEPGLALRIIEGAELEAIHRRRMEELAIEAHREDRRNHRLEIRWAQCCSLLVSLAGLGAGLYAALQGHEIAGSILGIGGIGGIVSAFLNFRPQTAPGEIRPVSQEVDIQTLGKPQRKIRKD